MAEIGFQHGWLQRAVDAKEARGGFSILAMNQTTQFDIIHDGTVFNKKFILTYNIAIVFVVLMFSVVHWLRKLNRLRRARRIKAVAVPQARRAQIPSPATTRTSSVDTVSLLDGSDDEGSPSSSKANTLSGQTFAPVMKGAYEDENAALLDKQRSLQSKSTMSTRLSAFFMYQPRPIPIINKVLPDNGTSFFVLCLAGLNIFYGFYRCPMHVDLLYIWADRTGLVFVANLPLLYFLGAKNQPLKLLTGHSYEQLNIFHRRLGEILCLLAVLHTGGMLTVWYTILLPYGWDLKFYLTSQIIVLGMGALICYEALYFTSLSSFRARWYEAFLVLHIIFQAAAMPLLWFHHHRCRSYVGIALAIFVIDRLIFRLTLKSKSIPASLNVLKDNETVIVTAQWPLPANSWYRRIFGLTASYEYGWRPTEHVFLTVPALSRKHNIQAHPFTIASAAPKKDDTHADFRLLIRAYDGFTRDLVEYAKYKSAVATIRLDGPYGSQCALSSLLDSDLAVVICGGSGIAVGYPLVCGLLARRAESKIEEDVEEDAAKGTLPEARICLIWVVHEEAHKSWLSEECIEELRLQGVTVLIPQPTAVSGRPDVSQIMENWVARRLADDDEDGRERVGVVGSGPEGMMRAVRNSCAAMKARGMDIEVGIEKYGW